MTCYYIYIPVNIFAVYKGKYPATFPEGNEWITRTRRFHISNYFIPIEDKEEDIRERKKSIIFYCFLSTEVNPGRTGHIS
jgi:hypothetical protein